MLQFFQSSLPHQLKYLFIPVELIVNGAEISVLFSAFDLVLALLLVGLPIEAAH